MKFATDVTERVKNDFNYKGQVDAISRSQGVIEFDLQGNILFANENFLKLMGYSQSEIVGKHHRIFVDPETAQSRDYAEFWKRLGSGEFLSGEFHRRNKSQQSVYIQASYNAILDMYGHPFKVVKYAQDVTARRTALNRTRELSGSIEELSHAVDQMAASGQEIARNMGDSRDSADSAAERVALAEHATEGMTQAAASMDGIVELINDITGQINLLALNATIESARAG